MTVSSETLRSISTPNRVGTLDFVQALYLANDDIGG
jgi:hypothetical protein